MNYKAIIKRQSTVIAVAVICLTLATIGASYALFFQVESNSNNQVVTAGTLGVSYGSGSSSITTTKLEPMSDDEALLSSTMTGTIYVENKGSLPAIYEVSIGDDIESFNARADKSENDKLLSHEYLRIAAYLNGEMVVEPTELSTLTASVNTTDFYKLFDGTLDVTGTGNSTMTIVIKVWVDEEAPESIINDYVYLKMNITSEVDEFTAEDGEYKVINGSSPLVLNNSFNGYLGNYIFKGNSVQSTTPTPSAPIEVESVGDRTKNLFDKNAATIGVGLSISTGGTYSDSKIFTSDYIPIETGKSYTYNWKSAKWYCFYDENKNFLSYGTSASYFSNSNASFVRFSADVSELDTFQVEEGKTATSYEPFGYKIPVIVSKNIFKDIKLEQGTLYDANGELASSDTRVRTELFSLDAGTYTFSINWNINKSLVKGIHIYNYDTEKWEAYTSYGNQTVSFTLSKRSKVRLVFNKTADATIIPEDVLNSSPTLKQSTEPVNIYLDEPLRKINGYVDYIDFENSKLVRNIKHIVFTGNENWILNGANTAYERLIYELGDALPSVQGFSNICLLNVGAWSMTTFVGQLDSSGFIRFYRPFYAGILTSEASKDNWIAFLKERYSSGNPVNLDYVLATPTEETIELPNISTFYNETVLSAETEILPSDIEVSYMYVE